MTWRSATKPDLAIGQVQRLRAAGLALMWAAFDEVYGRSGKLRKVCRGAGLAYVAIIPCDWQVTLPSGAVISAEERGQRRGVRAALVRPGPRDRGSATGP